MASAPMHAPTPAESDGADRVWRAHTLRLRRRVLGAAGIALGLTIAALIAIFAITTSSEGEVAVLIGPFDSPALAGLGIVIAFIALGVGLCLVPVRWPWLFVLVPARIIAVAASCAAAFFWWMTTSPTVTPLLSDGCETGYVVKEDALLFAVQGTVYRQDGLLVTRVAQTSGDDVYCAFDDGGYTVAHDGDALRVWYNVHRDPAAQPVAAAGEPSFVLPARTDAAFACGLSTGARTPEPVPPTPAAYDEAELRAGVSEMLAATLATAAAPVVDAGGVEIDPVAIAPTMSECESGGLRAGLGLEFATADNAASVRKILSLWDAAGYAPDRAMQTDVRYSERLPVRSISIHDKTTIDGLIHMSILSACSSADE